MKALVFDEVLKLDKNYPNPILKENEVLIKTSMVGICNTDYEITITFSFGKVKYSLKQPSFCQIPKVERFGQCL